MLRDEAWREEPCSESGPRPARPGAASADDTAASERAPGTKRRVLDLRVRWVPLPVSLLPLLLPRLVQLRFSPLDTRPGMSPLSGPSSRS